MLVVYFACGFYIQNSHLSIVWKKGKARLVERQTLKSVDFLRCSFSLAPATIFHPRQESSFDFARKCFTISKVFHQSPEYSNMFHKSSRVFFMATHNFIWISARYLCWIVPQNIEYPKKEINGFGYVQFYSYLTQHILDL